MFLTALPYEDVHKYKKKTFLMKAAGYNNDS